MLNVLINPKIEKDFSRWSETEPTESFVGQKRRQILY